MGACLYAAVKHRDSCFRQVDKGTFALAESRPTDIAEHIASLNQTTRAQLGKRLHNMPADRFETLKGASFSYQKVYTSDIHIESLAGGTVARVDALRQKN